MLSEVVSKHDVYIYEGWWSEYVFDEVLVE